MSAEGSSAAVSVHLHRSSNEEAAGEQASLLAGLPMSWLHALRRRAVTAKLAAAFAEAAGTGRTGVVRELLSAQYPRLGQALEDTLTRLLQDTQARPPATPDGTPRAAP